MWNLQFSSRAFQRVFGCKNRLRYRRERAPQSSDHRSHFRSHTELFYRIVEYTLFQRIEMNRNSILKLLASASECQILCKFIITGHLRRLQRVQFCHFRFFVSYTYGHASSTFAKDDRKTAAISRPYSVLREGLHSSAPVAPSFGVIEQHVLRGQK